MAEITLLQEAKVELIKRRIVAIEAKGSQIEMDKLLNILMPKYNMDINHDGKVRAFHRAKQFEKGIRGGVRAGKTYPIMAEAIGLSFINRPGYHLSVSPSEQNGFETCLEVLKEHCDRDGIPYDFIVSKNEFRIYWGNNEKDYGRILIHGMDSNWLGVTAASGDLNEPFSIHKEAYKDWSDRISSPKAKVLRKLWGGTAIPEKMQWGHEFYELENDITEDIYTDTFTTYGNTFLPAKYIRSQERMYKGKQREVRLLGKCIRVSDGDIVYYGYDDKKNHRKFSIEEENEIAVSIDFNVKPMTALILGAKIGKLHIFSDPKIDHSSTRQLCQLVISRLRDTGLLRDDGYTIYNSNIIITGDASGKHEDTRANFNDWIIVQKEFERENIQIYMAVAESNPGIRASADMANVGLTTEQIMVDPCCKDFIRTLNNTAWKPGARGAVIDEQKDWGHHSACFRYAVWWLQSFWKKDDDLDDGYVSMSNAGRER